MTRADDIRRAAAVLGAGGLVVMPTDTVYGLGARPDVPGALEAVFAAKGRPPDRPLPVLAASSEALARVVVLDGRARRLAARFWPGPLTLVLRRAPGCEWDLGAGPLETIAVRVPDCDLAVRLLAATGPLAVTSANRSGGLPATTVAEARAVLGDRVEAYIDGGPSPGEASTIVSLAGPKPAVLRQGALQAGTVLAAL